MKKTMIIVFALLLILTSCVTNSEKKETIDEGTLTNDNHSTVASEDVDDIGEQYAIGGSAEGSCTVHVAQYHAISAEIIDYVGKSNYESWRESYMKDRTEEDLLFPDCPRHINIKVVLDAFDISQETFTSICNLVFCPYHDLDILFKGTVEEIDAYYRNKDELRQIGNCLTPYLNMLETIEERYADDIKQKGITRNSLSVPELIMTLEINRAELEKVMKQVSEDGVMPSFNYNLDIIYGEDGVSFEPLTNILAVNHDDDPTNDISTNELNEMFCRVGRYAERE